MKKRELLVHLISELSSYFLQDKPRQMVISLHQEEDGIHLAVTDDRKRSEEEMAAIEHSLNSARRPELAGYYGEMAGHDLLGSARLNLIGWQIKHADVLRLEEGGMLLNLWIGGEGFEPEKFNMGGHGRHKK